MFVNYILLRETMFINLAKLLVKRQFL